MAKLPQYKVLYFQAGDIGTKEGAHCNECQFYKGKPKMGECQVVEGSINGEVGICGLYVLKGKKLDKESASYSNGGPTHCGNCKFYEGNKISGDCKVVEGPVEFLGCCNGWEVK